VVLRVTNTYLCRYIDLLFSNSSDEEPALCSQSMISCVHNTLGFPRSLFEVIAFWTGGVLRIFSFSIVCPPCFRRASRICPFLLLLRIWLFAPSGSSKEEKSDSGKMIAWALFSSVLDSWYYLYYSPALPLFRLDVTLLGKSKRMRARRILRAAPLFSPLVVRSSSRSFSCSCGPPRKKITYFIMSILMLISFPRRLTMRRSGGHPNLGLGTRLC